MAVVLLSYANNPSDPNLKFLKAEKDAVDNALRPWATNRRITHDPVYPAEIKAVFSRLDDRQYSENLIIFGFSGHAGGRKLIFNDEDVRGEGLATLMRKKNCPNLKIVFLNGCVSNEHLKFFEDNEVPIIITTNAPVIDEMAMLFAATFFNRLANHDTVYEAYRHAFGKIQTQEQIQEHVRCYIERKCDHSSSIPIWEFAYREERFKHWKLEMGKSEPLERWSLRKASSKATRLLFLGDKYFELIQGQFQNRVDIQLARLPLKAIIKEKEVVKEEVDHADAIVFHIHQDQANEVFRSTDFLWFPEKTAEKQLPIAFLKESCTNENLKYYQSLFTYFQPIVIPDYDQIDLNFIGLHKPSQVTKFICDGLDKEVINQIRNKAGLQKQDLLQRIESFDLNEQYEYLGIIRNRISKLNFLVLQGTINCGLELLLKKTLSHLNLEHIHPYRIRFDSNEGAIDTREKLYARLYALLSGRPEKPTEAEKVLNRLEMMLEDNDVCLILDNPLAVTEKHFTVQFIKGIYDSLVRKEELSRLYLFVINKALDDKAKVLSAADEFVFISDSASISVFPPVSRIEKRHFYDWLGRHEPDIRRQIVSTNLHALADKILTEPYLGCVLKKLCFHLKHSSLIDEILPKYQ